MIRAKQTAIVQFVVICIQLAIVSNAFFRYKLQRLHEDSRHFSQTSIHKSSTSNQKKYSKMLDSYLTKIRENWAQKTPKQKSEFIYNISDRAVRVVGVRVFVDDIKYWWTYSGFVSSSSYFAITIYTIAYHISHHQFQKFFNAVCLSGMSFSASIISE